MPVCLSDSPTIAVKFSVSRMWLNFRPSCLSFSSLSLLPSRSYTISILKQEETSFKKNSPVLTTDNPEASSEAMTHLENHLGHPTGDEGDVDPGGGNEVGNKKSYPKYILKVGGGGSITKLCPTLATPWTVA